VLVRMSRRFDNMSVALSSRSSLNDFGIFSYFNIQEW